MNAHAKKQQKKLVLSKGELSIWKLIVKMAADEKKIESTHSALAEEMERPFNK